MFIGRTDVEAETPILWPPHAKSWLIGKDPDAGKDWAQEEKGMREDDMIGWHHWCNGREFEQAPGFGDGQGGLACFNPWSHKESDTTEWLNWSDNSETARRKRWTGQGVRKELPCPLQASPSPSTSTCSPMQKLLVPRFCGSPLTNLSCFQLCLCYSQRCPLKICQRRPW